MKKLLIILIACICFSCESPKGEGVVQRDNFTIKTIDGCEYIEVDYGILDNRVYSLTHKGNCSNPIHRK